MKILILTQYFPPETGAPQNRLKALAIWFHQQGHHLEVLTGMPNYPSLQLFKGYKHLKQKRELDFGFPIHRVRLFLGGKGFFNRLRTYLTFCFNAFRYGKSTWKYDDFDWVFCESPPLFLGITASAIASHTGARLWFNVSDLWPESVEKLGLVTNPLILFPFYVLEKWLYLRAHFITGQTQGICKTIEIKSSKDCHWYPNGIADEELNVDESDIVPEGILQLLDKKLLLYSGNFGYAQGLEVILGAAELLQSNSEFVFVLLGDGPQKSKLESIISQKELTNVFIFSSVPRKLLFAVIKQSFASIVPLLDIELFHGAIPSKIFEPLALEIPVLLGVRGEAEVIFCKQTEAALFFEPENVDSLAKSIMNLSEDNELRSRLKLNGKFLVQNQFNRNKIHTRLFETLMHSDTTTNK